MDLAFDDMYLNALSRQDPAAEEQLVCCFSNRLRPMLRRRLQDHQLVEDAVQETMLRVLKYFRAGKTLQLSANLPAFVRAVADKVSLEMLRQSVRDDQLTAKADDAADDRVNLERALVAHERTQIIWRSLADLTAKDRLLLKLVFLDGTDKNQVCRQLSTNRAYLRVVLCRAKRRLKTAVERRSDISMKDSSASAVSGRVVCHEAQ